MGPPASPSLSYPSPFLLLPLSSLLPSPLPSLLFSFPSFSLPLLLLLYFVFLWSLLFLPTPSPFSTPLSSSLLCFSSWLTRPSEEGLPSLAQWLLDCKGGVGWDVRVLPTSLGMWPTGSIRQRLAI